jgi:two-component system, chemotaxis family, CheB/CheR fusion protein
MPYRTLDNVIDGVVITFIDISEAKRLEAELRAARTGSPGN